MRLNWNDFSKYRSMLMGCAIIGIVLCHLDIAQAHQGMDTSYLASIFHVFTAFVDAFFFLSGLGLYYSFQKNTQIKYFAYAKKRMKKLLPIYLLLVLITYVIVDIVIAHGSFIQVIQDLLFVSWFKTGTTKYWFVLAMMLFYLIFPFVNRFLLGGHRALRLVALILCYLGATFVLCLVWDRYADFKIAIERFPIFAVGIYCGKLSYQKKPIPDWLIAVISGVAIVTTFLLYFSDSYVEWIYKIHYAYYFTRAVLGMWMCIMIMLVLELSVKILPRTYCILTKILCYLGRITYEIYLLHQSYLLIFRFPDGIGYFVVAVVLPIFTSILIKLVRPRFFRLSNKSESLMM